MRSFLILFILTISLFSCIPHKKLIYFKEGKEIISFEKFKLDTSTKYQIQRGDILNVETANTVIGQEELLNKNLEENKGTSNSNQITGYVVNEQGQIELPLVGEINVGGMTLEEANAAIKNKFSEYLNYTFVRTTIANNKVTVLGEVRSPGTKYVQEANITIFQALGLAGDITDLGNRENVRILRKINNETEVITVDVSKTEIIQSNCYYLFPNDVIYVEPMKVKALKLNSSSLSLVLSSISLILLLIIRSKTL